MKNENTIPAVEKTLAILELLCTAGRGMTQLEINKAAAVSASTGYRILQTLLKRGWIRKNSAGEYEVASGLFALALNGGAGHSMLESAQPVLNRLAVDSKLTCKLSIRQWDEQLSLLRAESPNPFSVHVLVGRRFPVIEGTVGAALLCRETPESLDGLVKKCREDIIEKREPSLLSSRIESIRKRGWVLNESPNRWGMYAMSVPVYDSCGGVAAAITLLGVGDDFSEMNLPRLVSLLGKAAADCSPQME